MHEVKRTVTALLRGAGRVLPSRSWRARRRDSSDRLAQRGLRGDWERVGQDFHRALGRYARSSDPNERARD